ncbi:MAG: glycosyltransferase family 4 protein [Bacteroidetes bacterium]|nr:glycosyltransferase family 4 protein [Bacteroidota bacterium]
MKLAIISHTEHYKTNDGTIVGWSPTVNEINHLLEVFDEIFHIAMFHNDKPPPSVMPYVSDKIKFIPIPTVGGTTILSKLKIIWNAPQIIRTVSKTLRQVDYFQLRTPTGIGVFLIPYLTFFFKKKGWFKYAGNWNQKNPPLGYRWQRWMLKHQQRKVTINGKWNNQPKQCLTFENPCLTLKDLEIGQQVVDTKNKGGKLSFCFVGRLEKEKGVERIIEAFKALSKEEKVKIDQVHLVGNGKDLKYFKNLSKDCNINFKYHEFLNQKEVFKIYGSSHFFLLPTTASEGFPKVIAEAINFGCIPIVSNISSIGQYIKHNENGLLIDNVNSENVLKMIQTALNLSESDYKRLLEDRKSIVDKFTFSHYNFRIHTELLNYPEAEPLRY